MKTITATERQIITEARLLLAVSSEAQGKPVPVRLIQKLSIELQLDRIIPFPIR